MAVFPLENGVFSGTLLRFNVRGYVYIWSLIFTMFKFFVHVRHACPLWVCLCVLVVRIHYTFIWGNGEMGFRGNGRLGETGNLGKREYKQECKRLLKWPLHFG